MSSLIVTIEMKAIIKQYFPVVLFIMVYKVVLTFESVFIAIIEMKAVEQCFPVLLFIMLCKVMCYITFEFLDEYLSVTIQLKATERYFRVVYFAIQGGSP